MQIKDYINGGKYCDKPSATGSQNDTFCHGIPPRTSTPSNSSMPSINWVFTPQYFD